MYRISALPDIWYNLVLAGYPATFHYPAAAPDSQKPDNETG